MRRMPGWIVLVTACLSACAPIWLSRAESQEVSMQERPAYTAMEGVLQDGQILLPTPVEKGRATLEEVLAARRSVREFSEQPLALEQLGQLLWAGQGLTDTAGHRTAPSAGALYPLEVYLVTGEGVFHYDPHEHRLATHLEDDVRPALAEAALGQDAVLNAPAVIVIAAVYERTAQKYGEERSPRYAHLEAGHAAQNILLQAVALDLGAVPIGAFVDQEMQEVLSLASDQQPLYLIPVGHPQ